MVNVAGRSRGCATCRKRRVKCDESLPECLRCLNMGLKCPGARTDAFFVHAVPDAPLRDSPAALTVVKLKHEPSPQIGAINLHLSQLPGIQPSPTGAFDQLFVSHFIDCFFGSVRPALPIPGGTSRIWLHELPDFLASSSPSPVQSSIRAASMLSYGTAVGDASIKTEACRWYMRALQSLRLLMGSSSPETSVCAAVMLTHFETLAGTSPRAWIKHIKGAASLLEAQGPERCQRGFLHQIFSHLRLQTFVASMAENELHPFASPEWTTIPFEIHPKLIFDKLVDILFAVQRCLSVASRLITSTADKAHQLQHKLDILIQDARLQMRQWQLEGLLYASAGGKQEHREMPASIDEAHLDASSDPHHFMLSYNDVPSAALVTLYDTANIIVLRLLFLVSTTAASYSSRIQHHVQSILSAHAMANAASSSVPGRSSIMMVQQLKTVALWSPSSDQRAVAVEILQGQTAQNRGFADISAPSHEYFADVAAHIPANYSVD
ncbi:uncharacterized protein TRIVIDRAFT_191521 [Trichoderma virens Gv29-8]|uniref:Zn(2)-C6 fungal-type domain-containing protein n=1 Tax=Hypocrea virens (strain Gv29-8 / FGSC 10586) TaxID=413071 RepID=G9MS21_HYPVG|nr:uncharacterized protein TRIVIDRAFT_191521 [Trichoderma virens Gv29-8]EHK22888.1 hypothetical protein TRIVIDRAFT_191521 [Trichoderma virens Gv29-8]UKZ47939.1 hypothetical protein TrVGV298_002175 [Trichoderma virens]